MDAPYSVVRNYYRDMTMSWSEFKIAWEINYSGLYSHPEVNTFLNFLDEFADEVVPIGLRID